MKTMTQTQKKLLLLAACSQQGRETAPAQQAVAKAEWTNPGGDAGNTRHSALTKITPGNVGQLGLAWEAQLGTNRVLEFDFPVL